MPTVKPLKYIELISDNALEITCIDLRCFNKDELQQVLHCFAPVLSHPLVVVEKGVPVRNQNKYIPDKKPALYTRAELETLVGLIIQDANIKKAYIDSLSGDMVNLMHMLLREKWLSMMIVRRLFPSIVSMSETRWSSFYKELRLTSNNIWFVYDGSREIIDSADGYFKNSYIAISRLFVKYFKETLLGDVRDDTYYTNSLDDDLSILDSEDKAAGSLPVIKSHLKQGVLKRNALKATAASAKKIFDNLPIEEIFPDYSEFKLKYNLGQLYLPLIDVEVNERGNDLLSYHALVRTILQSLVKFYPDELVPAMLPHLKGMTAKALQGRCSTKCIRVLFDKLISADGKWLLIEEFCKEVIYRDYSVISTYMLNEARMYSDITAEDVTYSNYNSIINRGFIEAICAVLYGLGAVSIACDEMGDALVDPNPLTHMVAVRLNDLGKYALGMTNEYKAPEVQNIKYFSLETDRLVIRSVVEGNPYETLLYDTAVSIGGGRFKIDAESFLKHCKDKDDVESKTKFFQEYICNDLPDNWKAFFENIAKRCQPLTKEPSDYMVYRVNPEDRELINVISSDAILKDIVVKAEGYRILVRKKDKETFVSRLKTFGFLV